MIPKSLQDQRKGTIGLFIWLIIIFTLLLVRAAIKDEFDAVAALVGAIVATIPAILAYETIYQSRIDKLPVIDCVIDCHSRYGLFQLGIRNTGGSTAYNIRLRWLETNPKTKEKIDVPNNTFGHIVSFANDENFNYLSSLLKGDTHLIIIDGYFQLFDRYPEGTNFVAFITFYDRMEDGNKYEVAIPISFDGYRNTLNYTKEQTKTHFDLQKLRGDLHKIENRLSDLNSILAKKQ